MKDIINQNLRYMQKEESFSCVMWRSQICSAFTLKISAPVIEQGKYYPCSPYSSEVEEPKHSSESARMHFMQAGFYKFHLQCILLQMITDK